MGLSLGPNSANLGLVFAYDTGDTLNSYLGQPTVNVLPSSNVLLTSYNDHGGTHVTDTEFTHFGNPSLRNTSNSTQDWNGVYLTGLSSILTPGVVYTYSFYIYFTSNNTSITYFGYGAPGFTGVKDQWNRVSTTFTATTQDYLYVTLQYSNGQPVSTYYLANIQIEAKSNPSQFVNGTRSTTAGLLTLSGNNTVFLDNASFNGNAEIALDGSNDFIKVSQTGSFYTNQFTWEIITKFTANTGTYQGLVWAEGSTGGGSGLQYLLTLYNHSYLHYRVSNTITGWTNTDTASITFDPTKYNHIVWQFNNGVTSIYINGSLFHTDSSRGLYNGGTDSAMFLGARNDGSYSSAMMPAVYRCYSRPLSSIEIQENYKGYKTRFNLG